MSSENEQTLGSNMEQCFIVELPLWNDGSVNAADGLLLRHTCVRRAAHSLAVCGSSGGIIILDSVGIG